MEPKLISKPKFTVVGMKIRSKNEHTEFELYDESFKPGDPNSIFYIYIPIQ